MRARVVRQRVDRDRRVLAIVLDEQNAVPRVRHVSPSEPRQNVLLRFANAEASSALARRPLKTCL